MPRGWARLRWWRGEFPVLPVLSTSFELFIIPALTARIIVPAVSAKVAHDFHAFLV